MWASRGTPASWPALGAEPHCDPASPPQSRLSVNSVTAGDYSRPLHISTFINELDSGFRLLNLKNDSLRKRYDGLKYDVKKVEEVVYDLSIRGFNKQTAAACVEK